MTAGLSRLGCARVAKPRARAQPKPQITRGERREMALELQAVGLTQRETAAALGVGVGTVNRDLDVPNGTDEPDIYGGDEPEYVPNGTDDEPAVAPPERKAVSHEYVTLREVVMK